MKPVNRNFVVSIVIALLVVAAGLFIYQRAQPPSFHGAVITPPKPMMDFTLQSASGPRSLSEFQGKYVLLFFGYLSCTDACPLTMANLKVALSKLEPQQAAQVQVIFISVDYQRDTPEAMVKYLQNFNPAFIGLTGSKDQIDLVTKEYGVYYSFDTPDASGSYGVEHTASVFVLDRKGQLIMTWPYGLDTSNIASDLQTLLKQ